jgi:hypothetical protein
LRGASRPEVGNRKARSIIGRKLLQTGYSLDQELEEGEEAQLPKLQKTLRNRVHLNIQKRISIRKTSLFKVELFHLLCGQKIMSIAIIFSESVLFLSNTERKRTLTLKQF